MAFKSLQSLRKTQPVKVDKKFFPIVVLGEDLFSLSAVRQLWQRYGVAEVAFICSRHLDLKDFSLLGPNSLRGENNLKYFEKLYPTAAVKKQTQVASFYKESQFKSFAGRTKPEPLLPGESFYIEPRLEFDQQEVFKLHQDQNFLAQLAEHTIELIPTAIKRYHSLDLIEKGKWKVTCSNGEEFVCEKLIFGRSPAVFLDLYKDKAELSDQLIEVCEKTQTPCSLIVRLEYHKKVCEREESLFLPLSFTYQWGHFVGEFSHYDESSNKQVGEFIHFINKDRATEDEVSKKIRLLKRNLEKNFPLIKGAKVEEFIVLKEESSCLDFDNAAFAKIAEEVSGVLFIGDNAYLSNDLSKADSFEDSFAETSHLTRGLLSLKTLEGLTL